MNTKDPLAKQKNKLNTTQNIKNLEKIVEKTNSSVSK